ncbi:hypothetical protein SCOR_05655 [Sulfidibacter corallicola]
MCGEFVEKCRPGALGGPGTYCHDAPLTNAGTPKRFASIGYPLETRWSGNPAPGLGGDSVMKIRRHRCPRRKTTAMAGVQPETFFLPIAMSGFSLSPGEIRIKRNRPYSLFCGGVPSNNHPLGCDGHPCHGPGRWTQVRALRRTATHPLGNCRCGFHVPVRRTRSDQRGWRP